VLPAPALAVFPPRPPPLPPLGCEPPPARGGPLPFVLRLSFVLPLLLLPLVRGLCLMLGISRRQTGQRGVAPHPPAGFNQARTGVAARPHPPAQVATVHI
jgi:hypothetical protein